MSATNGLTDKQKTWVDAYLECWNGAEAARQAGYLCIYQSAHDNLTNPKIQAVIKNRLDGQAMTANEALTRLGEQARASIADFLTDAGMIDWDKVKEKGHLIKRITFHKGRNATIELYDAQAALMHIDKLHGGPEGKAIEERRTVRFDLGSLTDRELDTLATIAQRATGDTQ